MKNSRVKHFLTTREVSSLLGVSTGTVQKMVDKKILESYLTTGGHRRISIASVKRYMASMDPKVSLILSETSSFNQVESENADKELFFLVAHQPMIGRTDQLNFSKVTYISKPSDLFKFFSRRGVIVIDAAITWVDWIEGICKIYQQQERLGLDILIFNSQLISEEKLQAIPDVAVLFEGDLAVDFVRGYFSLQSRRLVAGAFASMN